MGWCLERLQGWPSGRVGSLLGCHTPSQGAGVRPALRVAPAPCLGWGQVVTFAQAASLTPRA